MGNRVLPLNCRQELLRPQHLVVAHPVAHNIDLVAAVRTVLEIIDAGYNRLDAQLDRRDHLFAKKEVALKQRAPFLVEISPKISEQLQRADRLIAEGRELIGKQKIDESPLFVSEKQQKITEDAAKVEAFVDAIFAAIASAICAPFLAVRKVVLIAASHLTALYIVAIHQILLDQVVPKVAHSFEKAFSKVY